MDKIIQGEGEGQTDLINLLDRIRRPLAVHYSDGSKALETGGPGIIFVPALLPSK